MIQEHEHDSSRAVSGQEPPAPTAPEQDMREASAPVSAAENTPGPETRPETEKYVSDTEPAAEEKTSPSPEAEGIKEQADPGKGYQEPPVPQNIPGQYRQQPPYPYPQPYGDPRAYNPYGAPAGGQVPYPQQTPYPPYPQNSPYPAPGAWGEGDSGRQGAWPPPPPPGYRWDSGLWGPGGNNMPQGSKKGGKAFAALFLSIGFVLIVALVAAIALNAGKYELPAASSSSSAGEPSASEPEESMPWQEGETSSVPEKDLPSAEPDSLYEGIVIQERRSDPISAKQIYKQVVESVVGVNTTITNGDATGVSEGSGIVLTEDGLILTNAHVLDYSRDNAVSVVLHDGTEYSAAVIGFDKYSDLAVLRIDATGLNPAEFGDVSQLEVGDEVFAIGNPGGMSYASSLTGGYISALNRSLKNSSLTFIQTDAAINPGNSGGALVNDCGQVVGVNSNKIVSTSYEGMGFAIPISQVKSIIDNLVTKGYVEGRGRLGITILYDGAGLQIQSIEEGSDLYGKAEKGDYILEADGVELSSMDELYLVLAGHSAGDSVELKIYDYSENTTFQVSVKLLEDKGETQATISPEP